MTTETQVTTPEAEIEKMEAALREANAENDSANAAFVELIKSGGAGHSMEDQLSIAQKANDAKSKVESLTRRIESARDKIKRDAVNAKVNPALETVARAAGDAFTRAKLADLLSEAGLDSSIGITIAPVTAEDGTVSWKANGRLIGKTAPRQSSGTRSGGGKVQIVTPDGSFGSTEYLQKYLQQAMSDGKVSWGTFEERMAFTKDHATRAKRLADILGHTVTQKEAAAS